MGKASIFVIPAVLLFMYGVCEGLVCYNCYSSGNLYSTDNNFVPCNEKNLTASNTMVCPNAHDRCIYRVIAVEATKMQQVWRTCSKGTGDPCDASNLPPGIKQVKCTHCGTDRCNLEEGTVDPPKGNFTFNINANINLFIRQ